LHGREIDSLYAKSRERGFTIIPTKLYFKDGRVKAELALGRGKDVRDKRDDISRRDAQRQIERAMKSTR
jgi:SsrA-binding protein